jgi:hypothetical protein
MNSFRTVPLMSKKMTSKLLTLLLPVSHFSVSVSLDFNCMAHAFFLELLYNHCQGLRLTASDICTQFDDVPLSGLSRNRIRPNTQLLITGRKNPHVHLAAWNFVHWLPRYANTLISRCIAVLQLLYRRQHQNRKLWIPLVFATDENDESGHVRGALEIFLYLFSAFTLSNSFQDAKFFLLICT